MEGKMKSFRCSSCKSLIFSFNQEDSVQTCKGCRLKGPPPKVNKYLRTCKGITLDVYDVLKAFDVQDPALQHLIKKALCVGIRGHKSREEDLKDILDSAIRAVELNKEQ